MPYEGPPLRIRLPNPKIISATEARINGHFQPKKSNFVSGNSCIQLIGPVLDFVRHRRSCPCSHNYPKSWSKTGRSTQLPKPRFVPEPLVPPPTQKGERNATPTDALASQLPCSTRLSHT